MKELHSIGKFSLPVPVAPSSVSSIKATSERATVLHKASAILIDEASMIPAVAVDYGLFTLTQCKDPLDPLLSTLKVGAIIMLIRNMNFGSGFFNDACMVVCGLIENTVNVEILTGLGRGNIVFIPCIKLISTCLLYTSRCV